MTRVRPLAVVAAVAAAVLLLLAGPASAHVTVNPDTAPGGGYSKLTFRVPTESDTASTTKLEVFFPADPAFASVSVKPHPGWTAKVAKSGQNVSAITWTPDAASDRIGPGEFDEFDISLGPLPDSGQVVFKALQTYSDGSVVRWIDVPKKGEPEPEHPAPVLTITSGTSSGGSGDSGGGSDSKTPLILSIAALALAAVALANSQRRRRS